MSNPTDTYLGIVSLHRSAKIRVKQYGGDLVNLHPTNVTWVNTEDDYNIAQLNHHSSVGQYLVIGQWNSLACGPNPPETDLTQDPWWIGLRTLNDTARIRVKGWQYDPETDTNSYGYHNLRPDRNTTIYVGFVPYDDDGSYDRGIDDEGDWQYNLRQLGHHNSIGQYVVADAGGWVYIQGLNDTAGVRVYDSNYNILRSAQTSLDVVETPQITSLTTSTTDGSLNGNQQYWYVVAAKGHIENDIFECQYGTPVAITTGGAPSSEIQIFQLAYEGDGTYSFTYDPEGPHQFDTAALNYDATAAQIKTALNNGFNTEFGTSGLQYVTTSTGSGPDYDVTIDFSGGPLAGQDIPVLVANNIDLNEEATIDVITDTDGGDPADTNTVTINWGKVNGAIGYKVYRSIDGDFDNLTSDEYLIADIDDPNVTSVVDDGSSTDNETPSAWWWTGLVYSDLDEDIARNSLNHHTSIGQYIVWPFQLNNDNND